MKVTRTASGWLAICSCGTIKLLKRREHIDSGRSRSCGCLHHEQLVTRNRRHGLRGTRIYDIWKAMHQRCENSNHPQYADYGGRGIRVCERWSGGKGAANFHKDMGDPAPKETVERRNNNRDYTPTNCYWATRKEQNRNKRNNLWITYKGRTQCLTAWAEEKGWSWASLYYRIVTAKWPVARAMETPLRSRLG